MNNRLQAILNQTRQNQEKLFCAYVTLGFPNLRATEALIPALEKAGTDILELGFPFSDPLADGPTIQYASEQALKHQVRIKDALRLIATLRRRGLRMSVLFFSYLNPILHYGPARLAAGLAQSGFDGLVVPDLTPDEGRRMEALFRKRKLALIYLIAPTTRKDRMREIARRTDGFIYYVSLRGVTGARKSLPLDLARNLGVLKRLTPKPVLVGFGVSTPAQAAAVARISDGVIVGSAIIEALKKSRGAAGPVGAFVSRLARAVHRRGS